MQRIVLVHWSPAETSERLKTLKGLGYSVQAFGLAGPESLRKTREDPPSAFVIDLSRLPSHGRDVAIALRVSKATRLVPMIFVDGVPEKLEPIKALLPDARYTHWALIGPVLDHALRHPPREAVVPDMMAAYSASPLPKKLGIRKGESVALLGAPPRFEETLGELPEEAALQREPKGRAKYAMVLLFTKSVEELTQRFAACERMLSDKGSLWIAWPKKTSGLATDLTQQHIREFGLERGLVDFKICAIDETWSGLRFARWRPG